MTTRNKQIVHTIGEINRTVYFFKNNPKTKYGLDYLRKELSMSDSKMRCIIRFLSLNKFIYVYHNTKSCKEYAYNKKQEIKNNINNKLLIERRHCLGMTLLILNELQDCSIEEINDCIKASKESLMIDIEKLQKQIKNEK